MVIGMIKINYILLNITVILVLLLHHYTITTDTLVTILNIVFVYGSIMASINGNVLFCPTRGLQFDTCNKKTIFTFIDKGSR